MPVSSLPLALGISFLGQRHLTSLSVSSRGARVGTTKPWNTAIHEAGHATVARLLGLPFEYVTIRPSLGKILGHVHCELTEYIRTGADDMNRRVTAVGIVLVAGCTAEEYVSSTSVEKIRTGGPDYNTLDKLLGGKDVAEKQKLNMILGYERAARQIFDVAGVRAMLLRVSAALAVRITLAHDEAVRAMVGDVGWLG